MGPFVRLVERETEGRPDIQAEEIFVDGLEVSKDLLDLVDHVVYIILRKLLNPLIRHSV